MMQSRRLLAGLFAVACAAGLACLPFRRDLRRARLAASSGGRIIETDAGPIEYAEQGRGFPLLAIHGAGGGYDQGLSIVRGFTGHDFRVIAPSRFGYLRTPVPADVSAAAQADAHFALLNKLNIESAVVVGVSAGARSALELAVRHPKTVAALILMVPGTYSPTSPEVAEANRGNRFTLWLFNRGSDFIWWAMEKIAPSVLIRLVGVPPELVFTSAKHEQARVMDFIGGVEPLSLRFAGMNIDGTANLHPLPLEKVTAPTLIICSRDDLFNFLPAAEFAAARITNAKLVVYDTGGHLLVGRQDQINLVIRDFLTAVGLISALATREPLAAHVA